MEGQEVYEELLGCGETECMELRIIQGYRFRRRPEQRDES